MDRRKKQAADDNKDLKKRMRLALKTEGLMYEKTRACSHKAKCVEDECK